MALLLGQARPILWKYVSNVAYESAQDSDIQNFDQTLNRLCQSILSNNDFKGCYRRIILATSGNTLTLPRNLSTCLGVDPICPDSGWTGFPISIYSRWFEFAAQGPGLTSDCANACCIRGIVPISDSAQTFVTPTGTWQLRSRSTKGNGRGFTLVGGLDQNGDIIEDNVKLEVINGTTTTTQYYTEMPFIEKAITPNTVQFYAFYADPTDSPTGISEVLLCVYAASETVPAYKQYVIPSASDGDTFATICKLEFVPAIQDTDIIIPSIIDALAKGLQSIQFSDRNDAERSGLYMGPNYPGDGDSAVRVGVMKGCIDILDSNLAQDEAAELPTFQMSSGYGCESIPALWSQGGWGW